MGTATDSVTVNNATKASTQENRVCIPQKKQHREIFAFEKDKH